MIKLSLITVSLNSQKIIKRTIDSINNQTSQEFETIYVDGKSNDETIDIIKKNYRVNDKLIVDQRCKETLWALDQYQWDPNPNLLKEKPKVLAILVDPSNGGAKEVHEILKANNLEENYIFSADKSFL